MGLMLSMSPIHNVSSNIITTLSKPGELDFLETHWSILLVCCCFECLIQQSVINKYINYISQFMLPLKSGKLIIS